MRVSRGYHQRARPQKPDEREPEREHGRPRRVGQPGSLAKLEQRLVRTQLGRSESVVLDRRLFRFESQLLSFRLPVKVSVFGADLIALNLSEASQRIGDGTTCRRRAVHERTGVGAV